MAVADARPPVRVEVLGPLRLVVEDTVVDVRGPKRRAVLALLALADGRAVSVDHLVDALWPSEVPESGRQALHSHVSRLRGHLGAASVRLETLEGGYRLVLGDGDLDVARARGLLARGRAHAGQDPAAACALLWQAHALWRGPVLADLSEVAPVVTAVVALEQLHREVTDTLIGCAVAAGRLDAAQVDPVVGIAYTALAADPLREPAVLQLMRVLAATGRAADALRAAREYRHRLADETGLDPSPALGELERGIAGGAGAPTAPAPARPTAPARPATRLIGRDGQVAALHRLLAAERLVTLVGPGGVGKTRVAMEVAREAEGTVLLLAPVSDPASIPHALAAALNLQVVQGDVLAACVAVLGNDPGLLVVDNCEHLLDAVRDSVGVVLAGCPELTVLTTSREPLGLAGERASRLAPLPVPGSGRDLPAGEAGAVERIASVAIFLDRASRVRPEFAPGPGELRLVADIVRRLDGMPLAIELAAGRLSTFSLADLHERLDRALDLLGGGRPSVDARHRTLRATIEWSYQLLSGDERRLFRHLSVFVDGVDLATAEAVAVDLAPARDPGSVLARLVDASMIEATFEGRTRFRMLETLRAFGLDRLAAAGEEGAAAQRLLRWGVALTEWIDTVVTTDREPDADAALRRELGNLRAVWRLARAGDTLDDAVAMAVALYEVSTWRDLTEVWGWSEELAADPRLPHHPRAAEVLGAAAEVAYLRGDYPRAERLARDGLALATDPAGSWLCLSSLAVASLSREAYADVMEHALAAAALARRPSQDLAVVALGATYAGDLDRALALNARMAATAVSRTMRGFCSYVAGEIDNAAGRANRAERHYAAAIDLARESGATFLVGITSVGLVTALAGAGRVDDALRGYREVIDYFAAAGNWTHQWVTLRNLAVLLRRLGDTEPAALIDAAADHAPDAPAAGSVTEPAAAPAGTSSRARVLEVARQAIEHNLGGS